MPQSEQEKQLKALKALEANLLEECEQVVANIEQYRLDIGASSLPINLRNALTSINILRDKLRLNHLVIDIYDCINGDLIVFIKGAWDEFYSNSENEG